MFNVFTSDGESNFSGIWSTITAARSFNPNLLNVPITATHYVRYTTGGTTSLVVNETLTGGTSTATAVLVAQAVENGTAGAGDSGILFLKLITGTPTATGETWTGDATGTVLTAQAPMRVKFLGIPKAALITLETGSINFTLDGTTPTVTAGTNYGSTINAGGSFVIRGQSNINNFKAINSVDGSGAIMKYEMFF